MKNNYFQFERESDDSYAALFCFHYAGGSPFAYAVWSKYISDKADLFPMTMAGRNKRADEKVSDSIESAAEEFAGIIKEYSNKRIFLTGHSMGGMVAYYTAYILENKYGIKIEKLFITASLPDLGGLIFENFGDSNHMNDDMFCDMLLHFGAIDSRMTQMKIFKKQFLPIIRADFSIIKKYKPDMSKKINAEIAVYYGDEDKIVTKEKCDQWSDFTYNNVIIRKCQGGHFFINDYAKEICNDINCCINNLLNKENEK